MLLKWGSCAVLVACLVLVVGCRTRQPDLKPTKMEELYTTPPMEARYETSVYPKQAMTTPEDPGRRFFDSRNNIVPTRGGGMPGGMGGRGY